MIAGRSQWRWQKRSACDHAWHSHQSRSGNSYAESVLRIPPSQLQSMWHMFHLQWCEQCFLPCKPVSAMHRCAVLWSHSRSKCVPCRPCRQVMVSKSRGILQKPARLEKWICKQTPLSSCKVTNSLKRCVTWLSGHAARPLHVDVHLHSISGHSFRCVALIVC